MKKSKSLVHISVSCWICNCCPLKTAIQQEKTFALHAEGKVIFQPQRNLSKSRGQNLLKANKTGYLPSKHACLIFNLHETWTFLTVASLVSGCVLTLSASTSLHFSAFASTSHWRQAWTPTWGQRIDWCWDEKEIHLQWLSNHNKLQLH